jgi:uncharacterized protein with GYD domain
MPRFLLSAKYTLEGLQGLLKEGGTGRRKAVETLVASLGGHLETFDYAFGDTDLFAIAELPDDETAAAISLRVTASGAATTSMTRLLTPSQIDAALDRKLEYRSPGS